MQPSEFWNLSTTEFWWEFDAKVKASKELEKRLPGKSGSVATQADWEAARKRFREKHG